MPPVNSFGKEALKARRKSVTECSLSLPVSAECRSPTQGGQYRRSVSVTAEINPNAAGKRYEQGWVDELHTNLNELIARIRKAVSAKEIVSLAYVGNVVGLWEKLANEGIKVDLGSDQTSLHNPFAERLLSSRLQL